VSSRAARVGIVVVGVAAAVALFFVFARGDDGGTDSATQSQGAQSVTRGESAQSTTRSQSGKQPEKSTEGTGGQSPKPQTPAIERIVVRGGGPVGGVKRLEYENGEQVRFSVSSDVADEVHVHGFDVAKDVQAGGSVRFAFRADFEGVFEVELEHRKVQIAELRVKP
jgi:cytoskeletal protein RodZ